MDIDFGMPEDILQDLYEIELAKIEQRHIIELRIHYQINSGTFDEIRQENIGGLPEAKKIDVLCSYRENNRIGEIESTQIIEGIPTGIFKVFIPYQQAFNVKTITTYVDNSLYFELRPNSSNPILLSPELNGESIEYFFDNQNYPLVQRWICSIKDFK